MEEIKKVQNKLKVLNDNKDKANNFVISQKQIIKTNAEILNKLGTEKDTCPVCLRPMEDHDHERVEEEKENIRKFLIVEKQDVEAQLEKITKFNNEMDKINSAIQLVNNKILDIGNKKYSIDHILDSIEYIKKCIDEIQTEIESVKGDTNTFEVLIKDTEIKLNIIKDEIDSIKKVINLMDVVKFVVSEEGVKSFIV